MSFVDDEVARLLRLGFIAERPVPRRNISPLTMVFKEIGSRDLSLC